MIPAANKFGMGEYAVWTEGDFNGDGLVGGADIEAMLAANLFGQGIYWPQQGLFGALGSSNEAQLSTEDRAWLSELERMVETSLDNDDDPAAEAVDLLMEDGAA